MRTKDRSAGTTGAIERAHEMLDALAVPAGSLAERIVAHLDVEVLSSGVVRHRSRFSGGLTPPMVISTRPQDWSEPARTILFGIEAERRRA